MKVVALKIKDEKKNIYFKKEAFFKINKGIVGDVHAKGGNRQVSLLSMESRNQLDTRQLGGFCTLKFHENITVDELEVDKLSVDDKLEVGDTVIQITSIGKACYKECPLYKKQKQCSLSTDMVFGKVIKSGIAALNDTITPLR